MEQAKEMAQLAYRALDDKKGEDIKIIDISDVSVIADYFLIATGNSDSHVQALVDNVEEMLHEAGIPGKAERMTSVRQLGVTGFWRYHCPYF